MNSVNQGAVALGDKRRRDAGAASGFQREFFCARLVLSVIAPALLLSGCASQSEYMGISLKLGASDPASLELAKRARGGDIHAQLELGIRYEADDGLPPNPKHARKLYRAAAATTRGTIFVYVPATRKGGRGIRCRSIQDRW